MANIAIVLTGADYAHVMPLATGAVKPDGIDLTLLLGGEVGGSAPRNILPSSWSRDRGDCVPGRGHGLTRPSRAALCGISWPGQSRHWPRRGGNHGRSDRVSRHR